MLFVFYTCDQTILAGNYATTKGTDRPVSNNNRRKGIREALWKKPRLVTPSHYQQATLNINLGPQKHSAKKLSPKTQTQTIAKTVLFTLSQPPQHLQMQPISSFHPDAYLKIAQQSLYRITPFHAEETLPPPDYRPPIQVQKVINHRRKTTEPSYQRSFSPPFKLPRRRFSQVAIITPSLKYPQEEGRGCGGKEWKQVYCSSKAKRQQQAIRKSVSLAVCQIAKEECPPSPADPVEILIKSLLPGGGVRSHSLPLRMEGRVKDYIDSSNKSIRPRDSHAPPWQRPDGRRMDLLQGGMHWVQRERMDVQLRKFKRVDGSNLFRKLNGMRWRKGGLRRQPQGGESEFQEKVLRFQSQLESERLHGHLNSRIANQMENRLTTTIRPKHRQTSSPSILPPS